MIPDSPIETIFIEQGIKDNISSLISNIAPSHHFAIVSDVHTYEVLGKQVESAFPEAVAIHLPAHVLPDDATVQNIVTACKNVDAIIAVGSGTINDLCKYASYQLGIPYMIFGTAPSMNGYSSANAAIIQHGHKKTLKAHVPLAVFLDIDILCQAPKRLIQSGVGDSLCRSTAQADWLLSHYIKNTPYLAKPFDLLLENEPAFLANIEGVIRGSKDAMYHLAHTLMLSGIGMYLAGGSYPASQGEHMIAHTLEMLHPTPYYHGEQIAVTTLTMARLQERVMEEGLHVVPDRGYEPVIERYFGPEIGAECVSEFRQKACDEAEASRINALDWNAIRSAIAPVRIPVQQLESLLTSIGAPTQPEHVGWDKDIYANACKHARFMRNRFTFLDVA